MMTEVDGCVVSLEVWEVVTVLTLQNYGMCKKDSSWLIAEGSNLWSSMLILQLLFVLFRVLP